MVPYDRDLIDTTMLTKKEIRLINEYHKTVYEQISIYLDENERKWLAETCAPLIDF